MGSAAMAYQTKVQSLATNPSLTLNKNKNPSIKSLRSHPQILKLGQKCDRRGGFGSGLSTGCVALGAGGSVAELEKRLQVDAENMEEDWLKTGNLEDKCKERRGIELLECLEREAIMGEDEGKEPNDYNRRAQIFDKSSRVFQALKDTNTSTT